MSRYPGRILSSTAPTVNANTAKGIWTLDEALRYSRAGQWPVPTGNGDPYFQYNTMLLPGQGTNGAQNNTFLDSSTNNFTITRNGNTTQGTFTPFSGVDGNWSNFFDGSGDYLSVASNAAFGVGSGDFTIECWIYLTQNFDATGQGIVTASYNTNFAVIGVNSGAGNKIDFYVVNTILTTSTNYIGLNVWTHLAFVRSSGTTKIYFNGVQVASSGSLTGTGAASALTVATSSHDLNQEMTGYISNVRLVKGTAVYTAAFTPPTAPLTAITNTSLLTCQSNRFIDNSTNAFALTVNGNPAVTPFQPFGAPTVAYSASTIGGSGYFDGSGDYLTAPSTSGQFGSGNFTVEAWIYPIARTNSFPTIFNNYTSYAAGSLGLFAGHGSGTTTKYQVAINGATFPVIESTATIAYNSWTHLAVVRSSGVITLYVNGVANGTYSTGATLNGTAGASWIGTTGDSLSSGAFHGYISGFRSVPGTAVYTAAFTPPTAPLTAITNTSLLLSGTNAGIIDNAQDNNLETVGNAQISTSQYKWGASSMYFDGTTDYLIPYGSTTNLLAFGSGAFTIEMWFYVTSFPSQYGVLYDCRPTSTNGSYPVISLENNGTAYFYVNTANAISSGSGVISTNRWYHLAVVKAGSSTKMFVNGNQVGSTYADTNTYLNPANRPAIGAEGFTLGSNSLNGYIADLRVTKGYARYPYNFTAPTAALPLFYQAAATPSADPYFENTTLLLPGNGTNGAQNNTFLDSSTNAFTITRNGNTTQGTFTPFSQTGWGNFFDGSGDYLTVASSADFNIFNGDMTFECWFYSTAASLGSRSEHLFAFVQDATNRESLYFNGTTLTFWTSSGAGNGPRITYANTPQNQWIHVAVTKSGSLFTMYINGVSVGTSTTTQYSTSNQSLQIGTYNNAGTAADSFTGYISNVRVVKGTNVYTTNFIPSTTPLTPVTNTVLLTCQSNRFIDTNTQTTAKTVTPSGDTSVQAFSPFNPTAAYSTSTVGGSGYFDGTGDTLTAPSGASISGTGDFTVETWIYPTSIPSTYSIIVAGDTSNSLAAFILNGTSGLSGAASGTISFGRTLVTPEGNTSNTINWNAWNHLLISRVSGTLKLFINGVQGYSAANTTNYVSSVIRIGSDGGGTTNYYTGYVCGTKYVQGSGVTSVTVPTTPPTATSGTSLLLNFTNGGIIDNTAKNNLETVGGASISTTVSKFGGSSMYFDGSGDWLLMPAGDKFAFGTGDYTVEAWVYFTSITTTDLQIIFLSGSTGGNNLYFHVDGNQISVGTTAAFISNQATSFSTGTWYHVAACRYSGTLRLFVNGVQIGSSVSDTTNWISAGSARIGANESGTQTVFGYINDHRVTKGIARYTTNFTPPTTAFLTL